MRYVVNLKTLVELVADCKDVVQAQPTIDLIWVRCNAITDRSVSRRIYLSLVVPLLHNQTDLYGVGD